MKRLPLLVWLLVAVLGCGEADEAETEMEAPTATECAASEVLTDTCEGPWAPTPVYVLTSMAFVTITDGQTEGFDLDGRVSERGDREGCGQADFVDAEGREGIDNQLGRLYPAIKGLIGDAVDGLIQGAINDGRLLIGLGLGGDEGMGVRRLLGAPLLGTDSRVLADQTFALDLATEPTLADGAWEGEVFSAGPADVGLPISIFDFQVTLNVRDARFRFVEQTDGSIAGVFAGALSVQAFMDELDTAAVPLDLRNIIRVTLSGAADLDPGDDGKCRGLSASVHFTAVPAWVADWQPAPPI